MPSPLDLSPRWALLADDLSGACDSAVAFARAGFRTRFELGAPRPGAVAELTAFSTETRESTPQEAAVAVMDACRSIEAAGLNLIYKKIDSVLRGPVDAEIAATLAATNFHAAVVCPAFPSQGRQVRGGRLLVHGEERGPVPSGERIEARDALTDDDLDRLAAELLQRPEVLAVGSGGLAAAWARALGAAWGWKPLDARPPRSEKPVALWVGSEHPATLAQIERLEASATPHRLVRVDMRQARTDVTPLAAEMERRELGALVLCGGATARRLLAALGAEAIEVRGEACPGAPWGTIRAGIADGLTVVTKSGGFGGPETFVEIVEAIQHKSTP